MQIRTVFSVMVAACFLGTTPGHAALLSYDEAVDGDLGFQTTTFTLDTPGTNTVSGSGSRTRDPNSRDSDTFFLDLAPDMQIVGFSVLVSNGSTTGGPGTFVPNFDLFELDGGSSRLQSWEVDLSTNALSPRQTPVPTPYSFSSYRLATGGGFFDGGVDAASWNYAITFQVAPVPLPATLPLLLAGGLGLTLLARRKRS